MNAKDTQTHTHTNIHTHTHTHTHTPHDRIGRACIASRGKKTITENVAACF